MYSSRWPIYSTWEATIGSPAHMTTCFFTTRYRAVSVAHAGRRPTLWSVANVSFLVPGHLSCVYLGQFVNPSARARGLCQRVEILGSPGETRSECLRYEFRSTAPLWLLVNDRPSAGKTHWCFPLNSSVLIQIDSKSSSLIRCTNVLLWGDVVYRLMWFQSSVLGSFLYSDF